LGLQGTHDLLQQDYIVEQNDFMMKQVKLKSTVIDIDNSLIVPHGDDNLIGFTGGDSPIGSTGGDNLIVSNGGDCFVDYSTYDDLVYHGFVLKTGIKRTTSRNHITGFLRTVKELSEPVDHDPIGRVGSYLRG
jgi:hypothetical protein